MSEGLVVVTALRSEYAALRGQVPGARLERCGMGPARVAAWLPRLAQLDPDAVVVAGVAGGLDPSLRPGDIIVACEVRDDSGRTVLRAARPLVADLRRHGLRVRTGPILSLDHVVGGADARERLAATGALAVDMESASIVREIQATRPHMPVAVLRVIVDTATTPLPRLSTIPAGAKALWTLRRTAEPLRNWADLAGPRTVVLAAPRSFFAEAARRELDADVIIVLGSANSSNSQRLVEVAGRAGVRAHLVDDATDLLPEWLHDTRTVGLTADASAAPYLVDEVIGTLRALGPLEIVEHRVATEEIAFTLPKEVAG